MGDVADILGFETKESTRLTAEASKILTGVDKGKLTGKGLKKPKGMSREVFGLLGQESITSSLQPAVPAAHLFKSKRSQRNKWIWAPVFTDTDNSNSSSASKNRNNPKLHHWMKSELQNCEYPYLKFDIKIDRISFTDEEYEAVLRSDKWTQSESEYLLDLCYNYDLRWPVIFDRYNLQPVRRPEDIQDRYYSMISLLQSHRSGGVDNVEKFPTFNVELERNRKIQLELLFHKTKKEALEESEVKEEFKLVDAALKKTKKSAKTSEKLLKSEQALMTSSFSSSSPSSSAYALSSGGNNNSRSGGTNTSNMNEQMNNADTITYSAPGKPALQSSRFISADFTTNLSKNLLKKLSCLLKELGLPDKMLPTKTICDLYDQVRRDGVSLLSLQNVITKKEKEITALKLKNSASTSSSSSLATTETDSTIKLESGTIPPNAPTSKNNAKNNNTSSSSGTNTGKNNNSQTTTTTKSAGIAMLAGSASSQQLAVDPTAVGDTNPKKGQKRKKSLEKPNQDDAFAQLTANNNNAANIISSSSSSSSSIIITNDSSTPTSPQKPSKKMKNPPLVPMQL